MAGRPYYGFGAPPPPPPQYDPSQRPHPGAPYMYAPAGVAFYPVHPAYFYPYPGHPHPGAPPETVDVVENPEETVDVVESPEEEPEMVPELPGEIVELPYSTYRWVPACSSQNSIPPGALRVGTDADGSEIYAGRAPHEGDMLPAKVIPSKNECYVCYGGEEIAKDQYEVLVPAMFAWQFATDGAVPPGAVPAGTTADGETLYYARVHHDGCTTPGKVQGSHGRCYYPFGGEERNSTEYEVLVLH